LLICGYGCNNSKIESASQSFVIAWENCDSFDDAPSFSNKSLDRQTSRFSEPEKPFGYRYFPDGRITINLQDAKGQMAAEKVANAVAEQIFKDKTVYNLAPPGITRFGYFVHADWGTKEEDYTGHVLEMMIDLDKRMIWYWKCD
jgi:hypothetical protein